jgi:hypothetical protein
MSRNPSVMGLWAWTDSHTGPKKKTKYREAQRESLHVLGVLCLNFKQLTTIKGYHKYLE